MGINPLVLFIQPKAPVTPFAPTRGAGGGNLQLRLQPQVRDYVAVLGLQVLVDEAEGYAFCRQRPPDEVRDAAAAPENPLPRLISRRPLSVRIGSTQTATRMGTHSLLPLPTAEPQNMRTMLFAEMESAPPRPAPPPPQPVAATELMRQIAASEAPHEDADAPAVLDIVEAVEEAENSDAVVIAMLREMLDDPECAFQPEAYLYQDFSVRCRMQRLKKVPLDLTAFRRRFALAKGGVFDPSEPRWRDALAVADRLPHDMFAPFLQIARAAMEGEPCPDDESLGRAYGTRSSGRIRRLVEYMEKQGAIVVRSDFGGRRSIGIPELGLSTEAE